LRGLAYPPFFEIWLDVRLRQIEVEGCSGIGFCLEAENTAVLFDDSLGNA